MFKLVLRNQLNVIVQKELAYYKDKADSLTKQLNDHLAPFCEESFISDEYTLFHTGLLNFKLKAVLLSFNITHR